MLGAGDKLTIAFTPSSADVHLRLPWWLRPFVSVTVDTATLECRPALYDLKVERIDDGVALVTLDDEPNER